MPKSRKAARTLPPPPPLVLNHDTTTPAMREALESLHSCLLCSLCNQVLVKSSTLPCAHTFCYDCMDDYACDAWTCPVPGCGAPLTVRGGREGSYLKTNPQIQTVVTSFTEICKTLNKAPKEWWKAAEEDESVDLQPSPSPRGHSPAKTDSEQTVCFQPPPQQASPQDWMDAIAEESIVGKRASCELPSQSPNCSPIAHMESQGDYAAVATSTVLTENTSVANRNDEEKATAGKPKSATSVRFQDDSATPNVTTHTVPTVLVASDLQAADEKCLNDLEQRGKVKLLSLDSPFENNKQALCLCDNAELETGEGYLVTRTYGYLLAVAHGIPIYNISYLQDGKTNLLDATNSKHQVIGCVDSTELMAPQRAIERKLENGGGTDLLDGYSILLYGDFDTMSKRARSGDAAKLHTCYSADRLERLLRTCGATVHTSMASLVEAMASQDYSDKAAVMLRPQPHPRDWRAASKDLQDYSPLAIISGDWLLDSIGDFSVKDLNHYTQEAMKK